MCKLDAGIKRESSMELHREPDIPQKTDWHLAHRIRKSWDTDVVHTDDSRTYQALRRAAHATVKCSVKNTWTDGMPRINGMESFWLLLKRPLLWDIFTRWPVHLERHADEFVGWYNVRFSDTVAQMEQTAKGRVGKCLAYMMLTRYVDVTAT